MTVAEATQGRRHMTKNDGGESGRVREIRSFVHTCTCMRLFFFCVVLLLDDSGVVVRKKCNRVATR